MDESSGNSPALVYHHPICSQWSCVSGTSGHALIIFPSLSRLNVLSLPEISVYCLREKFGFFLDIIENLRSYVKAASWIPVVPTVVIFCVSLSSGCARDRHTVAGSDCCFRSQHRIGGVSDSRGREGDERATTSQRATKRRGKFLKSFVVCV